MQTIKYKWNYNNGFSPQLHAHCSLSSSNNDVDLNSPWFQQRENYIGIIWIFFWCSYFTKSLRVKLTSGSLKMDSAGGSNHPISSTNGSSDLRAGDDVLATSLESEVNPVSLPLVHHERSAGNSRPENNLPSVGATSQSSSAGDYSEVEFLSAADGMDIGNLSTSYSPTQK